MRPGLMPSPASWRASRPTADGSVEQLMDAEPFGVAGRGFEKQDRADRVSVAPGAFIRVARGG